MSSKDIVHLYPKSSCPCATCSSKIDIDSGPPNNYGTNSCQSNDFFQCANNYTINSETQPLKRDDNVSKISIINPQAYQSNRDTTFSEIKECNTGCPGIQYISHDPRLYSVTRGNYIPLDRPPMNGNVQLKDVYGEKYNDYGAKSYSSYEDIKDGQIMYYTNSSMKGAYFSPNFVTPSEVSTQMYQDPMGSMKPQYNRDYQPQYDPLNQLPLMTYGLTSIDSSMAHREDIMAHQMVQRNQQRWQSRW